MELEDYNIVCAHKRLTQYISRCYLKGTEQKWDKMCKMLV